MKINFVLGSKESACARALWPGCGIGGYWGVVADHRPAWMDGNQIRGDGNEWACVRALRLMRLKVLRGFARIRTVDCIGVRNALIIITFLG